MPNNPTTRLLLVNLRKSLGGTTSQTRVPSIDAYGSDFIFFVPLLKTGTKKSDTKKTAIGSKYSLTFGTNKAKTNDPVYGKDNERIKATNKLEAAQFGFS